METTASRTVSDSDPPDPRSCVGGKWASADNEDFSEQLWAEQQLAAAFDVETPSYDPAQFDKWTPPGWDVGVVEGFWIEDEPESAMVVSTLVVKCRMGDETKLVQFPFDPNSDSFQTRRCKQFLATCRVGSEHAGRMIGRKFYYQQDPMSPSSPAALFAPTRALWCARLLQLVGIGMAVLSLTVLCAAFPALVSQATAMSLMLLTVCTLVSSLVYLFGRSPTGVAIPEYCFGR